MHATVTCTCADCTEQLTVEADADGYPVPTSDSASDQILNGVTVDWACPECGHTYETDIIADLDPVPVPWVGEVAGTETCIECVPDPLV